MTSLLHAGASLLVEVADTGLVQGGYWEVQQQQLLSKRALQGQFTVLVPLCIKAAAAASDAAATTALDETPAARVSSVSCLMLYRLTLA